MRWARLGPDGRNARATPGRYAGTKRRHWATLPALALSLSLVGCGHGRLRPDAIPEPALVPIQAAFERTLTQARQDPKVNWESGWLGNARINLLGGTRRGLCYEWRDMVYDGVIGTVRGVGWDATGVVISKDTYSEHSAVLVYDPKRVETATVLAAGPGQPVYVLDAWRRGEADIYPLHAWLDLPLIVRSPAQIRHLPVSLDPPGRNAREAHGSSASGARISASASTKRQVWPVPRSSNEASSRARARRDAPRSARSGPPPRGPHGLGGCS